MYFKHINFLICRYQHRFTEKHIILNNSMDKSKNASSEQQAGAAVSNSNKRTDAQKAAVKVDLTWIDAIDGKNTHEGNSSELNLRVNTYFICAELALALVISAYVIASLFLPRIVNVLAILSGGGIGLGYFYYVESHNSKQDQKIHVESSLDTSAAKKSSWSIVNTAKDMCLKIFSIKDWYSIQFWACWLGSFAGVFYSAMNQGRMALLQICLIFIVPTALFANSKMIVGKFVKCMENLHSALIYLVMYKYYRY